MADKEVWAEVGLTAEEYQRIIKILGREPNHVELGMYGAMWSEHCSYKNSKPVLKLFPTKGPRVLQGPGENAGVVDIGDGLAIAMKIESHNHPSAIEPYQGAATGVGGIIRDIFAMGARPIACLNSLRFGELDDSKVRYLFGGVVSGIAGYGNCIGIPTVGGEVYFERSYTGNPLVNAMCVGLIEHGKIAKGIAKGVGNPVMLVGARTGRDGIHGCSFASEELSEESEAKRPAVQVGDPFMEKLLMEACLELIETGAVVGLQDLGAAGLTSSSCEMASRGNSGIEMDLLKVPRREEGMTPYEIMLSESQERMLVVVEKGREEEVTAIFHKWGLNAVVIGHVTGDGMLRIKEGDVVVAEMPAKSLAEDAPVYHREYREPKYLAEVNNYDYSALPEPANYNDTLLKLLASPNIASKAWVYRQYDHMVGINTVGLPGSDAAVLRIKGTQKGIALTTDCNGRYCYLDPFMGGAIAVAEAARNLVCSGAEPLAVTDCLNFGNPEKPEIFYQFRKAVEGMSEACQALNTPVISGNVSFYNETNGEPVFPTPVVGMVGLLENIDQRCTQGFKYVDDVILLLGVTKPELGGSEYLKIVHNLTVGRPPQLDLELEKKVQAVCLAAIRQGLLNSAHDCSEGGLAVALAESCISGGKGAEVSLEGELSTAELLFSESQSRIVVSCNKAVLPELLTLVKEHAVPCRVIGQVRGDRFIVHTSKGQVVDLSVNKMEMTWKESIPCLMR